MSVHTEALDTDRRSSETRLGMASSGETKRSTAITVELSASKGTAKSCTSSKSAKRRVSLQPVVELTSSPKLKSATVFPAAEVHTPVRAVGEEDEWCECDEFRFLQQNGYVTLSD